jgi:N6-L-threonylcarbamoyladenine synthase
LKWYWGIDTSNYTTSCAAYCPETGVLLQNKMPLSPKDGQIGLRQSDAVFLHVKQLEQVALAVSAAAGKPSAIGCSVRPRDLEGSYMPCFLVGEMAAGAIAAANGIPKQAFSHQAGHIAAALYATGRMDLAGGEFLAFHVSGGTTECVRIAPDNPFQITVLSNSADLFAGQAVDRIGRLLGLGFPAGRELEALALASAQKYHPKPAFQGRDPCISGLENQCQRMLSRNESRESIAAYAIGYLAEVILAMAENAKKLYPALPVIYAGGVMSNTIIKEQVTARFGGYFASPEFSSDNAAGIAVLTAFAEGALSE